MQISEKKSISKVLLKVISVNILNLLVVIFLFILLRQLPQVALSVKKANTEKQVSQHAVDSAVLNSEIEKNADKTQLLTSTLSGDQTVISFVTQMDVLKAKGILTGYEFPITAEVTDKTGLHGLPVIATIVGTKTEVSDTIAAINNFKLLIRPITLNIAVDETGKYTAKFGVFLYTQ